MAIYKLHNVATEKYLNIAGSNLVGSKLDGQDVTIWTDSGSGEQMWIIPSFSAGSYIRSYMNRDVFLNAQVSSSSKYNCNVRKVASGTLGDEVSFEPATDGYKIKLKNSNMYLTVNNSANGTSVYWSVGANTNYQIWRRVPVAIVESLFSGDITANDKGGDAAAIPENDMVSNATYIYKYLKRKGFTKTAACAVLGNIEAECGMNPGAWESKDNCNRGYGLLQWTSAYYFLNWAVDVGIIKSASPSDINGLTNSDPKRLMDTELAFFMWTCELSGDYFTSTTWPFSKFKASNSSINILTEAFYSNYTQPNDGTLLKRTVFAQKWYDTL